MAQPTLPTGVLEASGPYLSDFLIESVKRRVRMPISQATVDVWELLATADEQIRSYVAPLMISVAEDYLTAIYDVAITSAASYRPPPRAMKIREVAFLNSSGNVVDVPRIALEDLERASWGFYFVGNAVQIVNPDRFQGYTLRLTFYLRPSRLVMAVEAGVVSSVNRSTGVVTLHETAPTGMQGGTTVDLVRGVPPFDVVSLDAACTAIPNGSTLTLSNPSAIPADWGVSGDFVCLPQQTPGLQVHPDLFALTSQAVAVELLDGNGDDAAFQRAAAKMRQLDTDARTLLAARVEGEPIPVSTHSPIWDRRWN